MTATEVFAKRLKELREKNEMTQSKAAEKLGITAQSLSLYEKGLRTINIDLLKKVAELFGVSSDYLIGISNTATTDTDMKAVCEFTGLTDSAVRVLKNIHETKDSTEYDRQYPKITRKCYMDCLNIFIFGYLDDFLTEILDNKINLYYLQKDIKRFEKELDDELNGIPTVGFPSDKLEKSEEIADFCRYHTKRNIKKLLDSYLEHINIGWSLINGHINLWNMTHNNEKEASDNGNNNPEDK